MLSLKHKNNCQRNGGKVCYMKVLKKLAAVITAAAMIMAMGITSFASADTQTTVTNPKFVKESGDSLSLGMGTGVIKSASVTEEGNIKVYLQSKTILFYTGTIAGVYCLEENPTENLVQSDDGGSYIILNPIYVEQIGTTGTYGIHVKLEFDMSPSTPPGMSDTMNAYFVCDEF